MDGTNDFLALVIRPLARLSVEEATLVRANNVIAPFFRLGYFNNSAGMHLVLVSDDPFDAVAVEALIDPVAVGE